MLEPPEPRLVITQTQSSWSCLPHPATVRWFVGWFGGFGVFGVVVFSCGIWFSFSGTLLLGVSVAAISCGGALFGIMGYMVHEAWRERKTPLVADAQQGILSFGPKELCRLDEISAIVPQENDGTEEPSFSLVVHLKDGRTIDLPSWFIVLPHGEALSVCASFSQFVGRT